MHAARLVRKDAEFCGQPRKESKSALCRLPQRSFRCQIPPAGVSPGVRREAQACADGGRVSARPAAEDLIMQHFHKPVCLNLSLPLFSLHLPPPAPPTQDLPAAFLRTNSSLGSPTLTPPPFILLPVLFFFPVSSLPPARIIPSFLSTEHPNFER